MYNTVNANSCMINTTGRWWNLFNNDIIILLSSSPFAPPLQRHSCSIPFPLARANTTRSILLSLTNPSLFHFSDLIILLCTVISATSCTYLHTAWTLSHGRYFPLKAKMLFNGPRTVIICKRTQLYAPLTTFKYNGAVLCHQYNIVNSSRSISADNTRTLIIIIIL